METWSTADARAVTAPQEVEVVTARRDGSLRRPMTIWIVRDGDRVFVRSTNGRTADWFRGAVGTGTGQVIAAGTVHQVRFVGAETGDLDAVDAAYRAKYGSYRSIVDHLWGAGPRAATLQLLPA